MIVAYLRVSTTKQHLINQETEIRKFARARHIHIDHWYHDMVSGSISSNERTLGDLLDTLHRGDTLVVTEISRLSRSLLDVMNIIHTCVQRGIILHTTKEGYTFENNLNSKILGFAFGLVAEIERNLISARTREALAARRAAGKHLGRPLGNAPKTNILHDNHDAIIDFLSSGSSRNEIAKYYGVSSCTLARFLAAHNKTLKTPPTPH